MIVAITGHRPDKLGGWKTPNIVYDAIIDGISSALDKLKPEYVISGMALGVDQWAAQVCVNKGIPFVAAIPFEGQESVWPIHAQQIYKSLLGQAHAAYVITPGNFTPQKMQARNKWMVDSADLLLAVWNGSSGGTSNCIGYANTIKRKIKFVDIQPVIWELAAKSAPMTKPSLNMVKPLLPLPQPMVYAPTWAASTTASLPISPFVSKIKEKAKQEQEKLLKQTQQAQTTVTNLLTALKDLGISTENNNESLLEAVSLIQQDSFKASKIEQLLNKLKDAQGAKQKMVEVKTKPAGEAYHRVIDLDD